MSRRGNLCAGVVATLSLSFLVASFTATAAFSIQPPDAGPLGEREFRHPDLWWSSVYRPAADLPAGLTQDLSADLSLLGAAPDNAYFDLRTARWGTLIVTRPLIPGPGVGNDLQWSELGLQEAPSQAGLEQAAWEAFRAFLAVHAAELRFDLDELAEPTISTVGSRLIRIHVGRHLDGLPVRDTFITAAINSGNLVLVGQRNWVEIAVDTRPSIASEQAEQSLRQHLEGIEYAQLREAARLEILPVSDQPDESLVDPGRGLQHRLVWVLEPVFEDESQSWQAMVDAHSGELLAFENLNHHLSRRVEGGIYPVSNDGVGDDGTEQPDFPMPFADILLDGTPIGFTTTGGNVPPGADSGTISTTLSGQFVNINDNCGAIDESAAAGDLDLLEGPGTDCEVPPGHSAGDTHASRSGFYELNRLKEQGRGYLPDNTWLQQQLTSNMNIDQNCNAFWSPSAGTVNFYTSGGGCANTGEIAAIFDHEWGHGMDNNDGVPSVSRPGEGIADIFAQNRLNESCIGRNFRPGVQCGGYGDPCIDCTGVRDTDWTKRQSGLPHDIDFVLASCPGGSNTPCGRATHCEGSTVSESAWDLVHRDLMGFEGSPFNLDLNTALELGTRLAYYGSSNVTNWYQCVADGTGGCNADSGYLGYLTADDDDGDLTNGTPHMSAIFAAFDRHQIACPTPTVQDSGCAGAPTTAPANLATTAFDEGMELTWDPVADATEYWVFRTEGVNGCDFGKALVGKTTDTSFTETGLRNGFELLYSVVAVGASDSCTSPMSACQAVIPVAGPSGVITGTVTNSVTQAPVQGVAIEAVGPVTLGGLTLADGTYQIAAPVGTYEVTASEEGFFPQTQPGVEVTEGGTVTVDFALVPLPQTADISPTSFTFEEFEGGGAEDTLNIGNIGNVDLTWSIAEAETDCATPGDVAWLSAAPASGVTPPFDSVPVAVAVDSTGLAPGLHEARFCVTTDDPEAPLVEVPVSFNVLAAAVIDVAPPDITITVDAGTTHIEELTVSNLGSATLDWTILLDAGVRGINAPLAGRRPMPFSAPRGTSMPAPVAGAAEAEAVGPELVEAAEAGIELDSVAADVPRPTASGLSPGDVLVDGALLVPNTTAGFIVALDPETGDVIDPALINIDAFTGARREALLHPDGERILLTAQTGDVVHAFSVEDGSYLGVFAPAGGADTSILNNVRGMDFHPVTGNLLVTSADDPAADRVVEFDLEGNFVRVFIDGAANNLTSPWDLLVRESDILVTNFLSPAGVQSYDFDGNFLGVFADLTGAPAQMAFAANGNILVSSLSDGLYELAPDGTLVANYKGTVTSQAGVYELPNLNFLITGSVGGQGIQELDRNNQLVETKMAGTSYFINFAKSLDCTIPEWLTVNPTSGSTGPGSSTPVTVTIDATDLGLGEHTAGICFESNDPLQPVVQVPVTITVVGQVPIADISPTSFEVELPFGGNTTETLNVGNVGLLDLDWSIAEAAGADSCDSPVDVPWLNVNPTAGTTPPGASVPVDVVIDAAGLSPAVYEAALCASTNDPDSPLVSIPVTLTVLGAGADISPTEFQFEVFEGGTANDVLNIGNPGTADLVWSLGEAEADCASPVDVSWLSAAPTSGTTPPQGTVPVDVAVDTAGLAAGDYSALLCVTTNDPTAPLVPVPVQLSVLASPVIDVVPDSLEVILETNGSQVEPVDIHNLGSGVLDWSIPTEPALETLGESDPLIGFTFKTASATTPDPQNWTRISTGSGTLENVLDDTGEATDVTFSWGPIVGSMSFLGTSTLAADAVPQYDYDLSGMTGYGFGADDRFFIELSGLDPNAPYEFWFVAYRGASAIDNVVDVSDGDVVNAFQFNQVITSGDNDGRFIVNDQVSSNTQQWNDLAFSTTSSSNGTIRIEWEGATQTTVIGAFAVRPLLNCALPDWLSIAPTSGSINPGDPPDTVDATFAAGQLEPGTYTDAFCVESNDPFQPVVPVPVTLTVTLPGNFATIEGTVQSLGYCGADVSALEGATVQIAGAGNSFELQTDENGLYQIFLPDSESPIDITVSAAGHLPAAVEDIVFAGGDTVVQDFDLTLDAPCATVDPASFAFDLRENEVATDTLTLGNTAGGADLSWTITTAEPPAFASGDSPAVRQPTGPAAVADSNPELPLDESAIDIASILGETLPGLSPVVPLGGVVDCDGEPGIVLHDDGTVENGYSGNPAGGVSEVIFADRFTPDAYPTSFDAVCLAFITLAGGPTTLDFEIVVFDDDGADGSPGSELGSLMVNADGIPQISPPIPPDLAPVWFSYDISSLDISVDSGSVYIGARWAPPSPVNVFVASDQSTDRPVGFAAGQWWNNNANAWAPIQVAFPSYRSLMVRAVQSQIDCDNPTEIPWLSVSPTSGTTPAGGSSEVTVTVDATGLAPGEYTAGLCVATNDPQQPLTVVPVSLNVSPSGITLTAEGRRVRGVHVVDLHWEGAISDEIDVRRDGAVVATVPNSGMHEDVTGNRGNATYVYEVCEAGTAVCSNEVTVVFGPPGGGR